MRRCFLAILALGLLLVVLPTVSADDASETAIYKVDRTYELVNNSSSVANDVTLTFYAFDDHEEGTDQRILSENIAPEFSSDITSTADNRIVQVDVGKVGARDSKTVTASYKIRIDAVHMELGPKEVKGEVPAQYLKYTEPVPHLWQSGDPQIKGKAHELTKGLTNHYSEVERIVKFVENHLSYEGKLEEHGALWALNHEEGDCSEYSNLFIALCRAENIPAKAISGYLPFTELYGFTKAFQPSGHQWAIVYLPSKGWAPVDLTYLIDGNPQFGDLSNTHLVELVSDGGNWVEDSDVSPPTTRWSYAPRWIDLGVRKSGTVTREVAVNTKILSPIHDYPKKLEISVKVSNEGTRKVSNLKIMVKADNKYFDVPSSKEVQKLSPGTQQNLKFELGKKRDAENEPVKVITSYDAAPYGTFESSEQASISTTVTSQGPPELIEYAKKLFQKYFFQKYFFLVSVLIGALIIGIAAAVRR